jgi:cytoskeleton protein RodZ
MLGLRLRLHLLPCLAQRDPVAHLVLAWDAMPEVGRELAQARERCSLTVEEISHRTKISVAMLQAIERDEMKDLPRGIYRRGMLRAYAREVGCDPADIVRRFRASGDDLSDEPDDTQRQGMPAPGNACHASRISVAEIDAADAISSVRRYAGVVVLIVLIGGGFYLTSRPNSTADAGPSKVATGGVVATSGDMGAAKPTADAQPVALEPRSLRLDIHTSGPCWLSGTADGQQVIYRMLNSGDRAQIEAHEEVVLRIGDSAAFSFTINGAAARAPGTAGQPVTIHITPKNYREFLSNLS